MSGRTRDENRGLQPTVAEVANDVKLGSVDVGIVWSATVSQYPELETVRTEELDRGTAQITLAVMRSSRTPTAALKFARFLTARDKGLAYFAETGYEPVDGDIWEETPELTFFAGSVNRRALEPIINKFQEREGVIINTVYNGCGILTAQMRTLRENQGSGFPDVYMACDVYYLETVQDLFQEGVNVSNTDIVIVTQAGNPKQITGLADLAKPGMRVAVGQPDQCTIGVLSRRLLESTGLLEKIRPNIVYRNGYVGPTRAPGDDGGRPMPYWPTRRTPSRKRRSFTWFRSTRPWLPPSSLSASPVQATSSIWENGFSKTIERSPDAFTSAGFKWRLSSRRPGESSEKVSVGDVEKTNESE